jgi:hypothetical protein
MDSNDTGNHDDILFGQKTAYILAGDGRGVPLFNRQWFYENEAHQIVDEHNEQVNAVLREVGKLGAYQEVVLDPKPPAPPKPPAVDKRKEAINSRMEVHLKNVLATSGSLNDLLKVMSGR